MIVTAIFGKPIFITLLLPRILNSLSLPFFCFNPVLQAQQAEKKDKGLWMHRHKSLGLLSGMIVLPRVGYRLFNAAKVRKSKRLPCYVLVSSYKITDFKTNQFSFSKIKSSVSAQCQILDTSSIKQPIYLISPCTDS